MRYLSGIQPSGTLHLGNYFGAMREHLRLAADNEAFYFIADYHALTTSRDPEQLRTNVFDAAVTYLALGLDPQKAALFRQSDVPEVCELTWLLSCVTGMGLLERAHSYKDKVAKGIRATVGLFTYPALMAADILIYKSNVVPVGQDQVQHIEMAQDMAGYFNNTFGREVLKRPEAKLNDAMIVPGIDGQKMSKSYGNVIEMFAPKKQLKKSVMGIVTDSTPVEAPKDPSGALFQLYNLFASEAEQAEMADRARAGGTGYGDIKKALLERILDLFGPMRERRERYEAQPDEVEAILRRGAERARAIAMPVLERCREAVGIGQPG